MTMTMRAVVVEEFGPAENLKLVELPKPVPRPGEVIVKVAFCGVNFIDVYFRTGLVQSAVRRCRSEARPPASWTPSVTA